METSLRGWFSDEELAEVINSMDRGDTVLVLSQDMDGDLRVEKMPAAEAVWTVSGENPDNGRYYQRRCLVAIREVDLEHDINFRNWDQSYIPWERPQENTWGNIV